MRRRKPDHEVNDMATTTPCFGFPSADDNSHKERIIATNLMETKVWTEKKMLFAPESGHLPQFVIHPIKASVTTARPLKFFYELHKDYNPKHIAVTVIPFSPENFKCGRREKIQEAANAYEFHRLRFITMRDALFMGVAYSLNVDMPTESLCLFVIVNAEDFVCTIYDRYEEGYLPRLVWVIPYDLEQPEVAIDKMQPLKRFLQRMKHICVAVYENKDATFILTTVFGEDWFSAPMDKPDEFYHQHLCIAGAVVKGRNIIGVKDLNYWNVLETCPYEFQVRSANEEVMAEFFVALHELPLKRTAEVGTRSGILNIYCRDFPSTEWVHIRSVVVDPKIDFAMFTINMDVNCAFEMRVNGEIPEDYVPEEEVKLDGDVEEENAPSVFSSKSSNSSKTKANKMSNFEFGKSLVKPLVKPMLKEPMSVALNSDMNINPEFVMTSNNFIELCYYQNKFHFRMRTIGKPAGITIMIRGKPTIHCSVTLRNGEYIYGEESVRIFDSHRRQTIHSFVDFLVRDYQSITAAGFTSQPCLVPSKYGDDHPAQVFLQDGNNRIRADIDVLLGFMIMYIKEQLEVELNTEIKKMAFNPSNGYTTAQHSKMAEILERIGVTYLKVDGSVWTD